MIALFISISLGGYVYDDETELYYLKSRYYRAELERFISADALVNDNLYSYCFGNPIVFSDANGYEARCTCTNCENGMSDRHYSVSQGYFETDDYPIIPDHIDVPTFVTT